MKQINERIVTKGAILESDGAKLPKGVLCRVSYNICNMDKLNANNRMYERQVWDNVLNSPEVKEKMASRTLWGHSEHPEKIQSNIEKVSHVITSMHIDEKSKEVKADMDVLDTPYGRIVNTLLLAECGIGVSTRAEGELEEKDDPKFGKYFRVIPEAYKFITVDFTADPSTFGTYPEKVERDMVGAIKQGVDDSKIDMQYATVMLEGMKIAEAKTLLETIKADKHHKGCTCKASEKKCGKGCQHMHEGFKYVCNACGAEDIDTANMKQIPHGDRTLHACAKCKDVPVDQFKAIDKYDVAIKEAVDKDTEYWIKAILTNDEASTDEELLAHFQKEGGLSKEDAQAWVAKRDEALRDPLKFGVKESSGMNGQEYFNQLVKDKGMSEEDAARKVLSDVSGGIFDKSSEEYKKQAVTRAIQLFKEDWTTPKGVKENEVGLSRVAGVQYHVVKVKNTDDEFDYIIMDMDNNEVYNSLDGIDTIGDELKDKIIAGVEDYEKETFESKGDKMKRIIFESYDDMVEFFKKEFQKPDSVVKSKFRSVLSESLAPSDVSANVRQLKIDRAIAIAERDTVFEALRTTQSELTTVKENYSKDALHFTAKNKDLTQKLSESVNKVRAFEASHIVTTKTISEQIRKIKALEEVKSTLTEATKTASTLTEKVNAFEKKINEQDAKNQTILEGVKKEFDTALTELKAKHERDLIAKYFETKMKVSGLFQYLKEDANVSALLEHCKKEAEVDRLIENISGRVEDGILHSISPSEIVVGKATDPATQVLESRIAASLKSMGR